MAEPTRDPIKVQEAMARAREAGDEEALAVLREDLKRSYEVKMEPGNWRETMGAGMTDIGLGLQQLVGAADPERVREHLRIAEQATGGTFGGKLQRGLGAATLAAPAMFIPGAQTVGGAALIGGGLGLAQAVDPDDVVGQKAMHAGLGAATGGLAQKGFNVAGQYLPRAVSALKGFGERFVPGGREAIAGRALVEGIPQAERAAAEQTLRGTVAARQPPLAAGTTGAPVTTAAALRRPEMLGVERGLREAGGELGQPLRDVSERAAQVRWQHLEQNVGGDVAQLAKAANDVYDNFIGSATMKRPFDVRGQLGDDIIDAVNRTHNTTVRAELERIFEQYTSARAAGDVASLHELRMTAFDDAISRLMQSDRNAAKILRNTIQGFKSTFDDQMDRALGPGKQWSGFLGDYARAAGLREQARAGEQLLGQLATRNVTPGGAPTLTGAQPTLARAAAAVDDFGQPIHSPAAQEALLTVRREIGEELLPYTMGPRGSATAQNLVPTNAVLKRALEAQRREPLTVGTVAGAELAGTMAGHPGVATTGLIARNVVQRISDRQALDIARRLVELYADPQRALQALASANLSAQAKQSIAAAILGQRPAEMVGQAARSLPAATTAAATAATDF